MLLKELMPYLPTIIICNQHTDWKAMQYVQTLLPKLAKAGYKNLLIEGDSQQIITKEFIQQPQVDLLKKWPNLASRYKILNQLNLRNYMTSSSLKVFIQRQRFRYLDN
jgi:hypothetical protein